MNSMHRVSAVLLLLAGCGGAASTLEPPPEEFRQITRVIHPVADRHPYGDVTKLKIGQWARYTEGSRTVTIAAVGKEGDGVWIEVIDEGEEKQASARLVAPDGTVKKAFYREVSRDGPTEVVPQPLEQASARPAKVPDGTRETGEEKVSIGGRELACRLVRLRSEDLDGRIREEVTLWHPDVPPLYAGTPDGGLVRRTAPGVRVELAAFGTDAKPLAAPAR